MGGIRDKEGKIALNGIKSDEKATKKLDFERASLFHVLCGGYLPKSASLLPSPTAIITVLQDFEYMASLREQVNLLKQIKGSKITQKSSGHVSLAF